MESQPKAVCLFSGGLDSTTVLYDAVSRGYRAIALSIQYGQVHERELDSARSIAKSLNIKHEVVKLSFPWGGSALLGTQEEIPLRDSDERIPSDIPPTYVPARNTVFLSVAASLAEVEGADVIFIGANAIDYSGYPDCRPEFLEAMERTLNLGTKAGAEGKRLRIEAPLVRLSKREIVELAFRLSVPFEKTWSCYSGQASPCGLCDSCLLRKKGFEEAGVTDPLFARGKG